MWGKVEGTYTSGNSVYSLILSKWRRYYQYIVLGPCSIRGLRERRVPTKDCTICSSQWRLASNKLQAPYPTEVHARSLPTYCHKVMGSKLLIGGEPRAMTLFSLPSTAHPAWQIPKGLSLYSLLSLAREGAAYSCTLHYPWANAQQVCGQNKNQSSCQLKSLGKFQKGDECMPSSRKYKSFQLRHS